MYIHCSCWLFVVLTISWLTCASSSHPNSSNNLLDQLTKSCPTDGIPVCGVRDKQFVLFSNGCLLNAAVNKDKLQSEKIFKKVPLKYCMTGCQLSCPKRRKPVCARNMKTYQAHLFRNQCELVKYICKTNMDYLKIPLKECPFEIYSMNLNKLLQKRSYVSKEKGRPVPCLNILKPVCGSYMGVKSSFRNECLLNAENVDFDRDWRIVNYGMCPEDYLKSRRHKDKPNKRHSIAKRSYHNNLYNQLEYNANSFVGNKNELNVAPNDLYVYMQPELQTQYLSHDASSHQHSMPEHKAYDEILSKIAKLSPTDDVPFPLEEDKRVIENSLLEQSTISPVAFAVNRLSLNYLSGQNLAIGVDRQPIPPVRDSFLGSNKKEYYYELAKIDPSVETDDFAEITTATYSSTETSQAPESSTTAKSTTPNVQDVGGKNIECKFGTVKICAALADGTVRTFETICEMMTANVYFKNTWTKLHEGSCEDCKHNCSRDYQPVCVSRNGANYTMVNECYYNMAICMDKKSKWQILSNRECERYTRIIDKYANSKPGFPYTSNYFISQTTEIPSTTPTTTKTEKVKLNKNRKRGPNFKRAVKEVLSSHNCCPASHSTNESGDKIKCECVDETTPVPSTTESHIMSFVKAKDQKE